MYTGDTDELPWRELDVDDLWIYDKLILARKLNYVCGPVGNDVPKPDNYIVRPCVNFMGMGYGAKIRWIEDDTDHLPKGYFWCEVFEGRHLSVDYVDGEQVLCVEGFRNPDDPLYKWKKWEQVNDTVPYPSILKVFPRVNCEFIDGNLIEVHLRHNPDFRHESDVVIPVWEGEDTTPPKGMKFVKDDEHKRLGFFIKK